MMMANLSKTQVVDKLKESARRMKKTREAAALNKQNINLSEPDVIRPQNLNDLNVRNLKV